jgi:hypothetical protein
LSIRTIIDEETYLMVLISLALSSK